MEYVKLGSTGLDVSRLCLGCMTYGEPDRGPHPWTLDEEKSRPLIRRALEAGINFFDTANFYSDGSSEEILGRAIRDFSSRDDVVIATKVFYSIRPGPNAGGLSRKVIMREIDNSLRRLGTDYVDLYQIHRWDHGTPIEETLAALNDVVRAGKVRYIGASSMYAWQFAKALYTADHNGWPRFVSMQEIGIAPANSQQAQGQAYDQNQSTEQIRALRRRGKKTTPCHDQRTCAKNLFTQISVHFQIIVSLGGPDLGNLRIVLTAFSRRQIKIDFRYD